MLTATQEATWTNAYPEYSEHSGEGAGLPVKDGLRHFCRHCVSLLPRILLVGLLATAFCSLALSEPEHTKLNGENAPLRCHGELLGDRAHSQLGPFTGAPNVTCRF